MIKLITSLNFIVIDLDNKSIINRKTIVNWFKFIIHLETFGISFELLLLNQ